MTDERESTTRADEERVDDQVEDGKATTPSEDDEISADAPEDEADEEIDGELAALQEEVEAMHDRHARLAAEFDNYRKRVRKEREELRMRAQADLIERLLEVLDDLQRVADYEPEETSVVSVMEGVELVEKKFRHALESLGLEPIQAEGEYFNPTSMEALMAVPTEKEEDDDIVADVFEKGYRFQSVLVRPARVRVKKYEKDE